MIAANKTLVLDHERVGRKLKRIAIQLHEENCDEKSIVLVGIAPRGSQLAKRLQQIITENSDLKVELCQLALDKQDPLGAPVKLSIDPTTLAGRTVVLVDDVLMSGRTLMYAVAHLVRVPLKKLTTVVLVDRRHRSFPIRADIVGLTLSTTLQEHISVELGKKDAVHLS